MSGTIACPICRRRSWLTADGLAHHLGNDHARGVVAETLAQLVTAPAAEIVTPDKPPASVEVTAGKCPGGKRRFDTERDARVELVGAVIGRNRGKPQRRECRVYLCPACGGYHLTSMSDPPIGATA